MLFKVESAPFEGGKLPHGTSDQLFINKRKAINSKSAMGTPDDGKHTAAESPEISAVNKRKLLRNQRIDHTSFWVKVRCGLKKLKASIHTLIFAF